MQGWGGSCRGGVGGSCRSGVGHAGMGWDGPYQDGVGQELQGTESRNATGYQI